MPGPLDVGVGCPNGQGKAAVPVCEHPLGLSKRPAHAGRLHPCRLVPVVSDADGKDELDKRPTPNQHADIIGRMDWIA